MKWNDRSLLFIFRHKNTANENDIGEDIKKWNYAGHIHKMKNAHIHFPSRKN